MLVSRLLVSVFISVVSAFTSSASTFPSENGSQEKTVGAAAGQQTSRGVMTVLGTNAGPTGEVRTPGSQLKVSWESGKLSLDAETVPLSEVLLGISRVTGIEVRGAEELSNLVTMHLTRVELFQAVRELLSHVDYAITAGPPGSASPRGTQVLILGRSLPDSSSTASVAQSETNAPAAEAAIQPANNTPADADPQANKLASMQGGETGEDREAVTLAPQQLANPSGGTDQQSLSAAAGESKDPDPSPNPSAVPPPTQNADAVGLEASREELPLTEQLDDSQTKKLATIEAAATSQDREALGKYMQDPNAAVQAAAFDALAAHDNPAAIENLLSQINDLSQPTRLQALQLLTQLPQSDEQTVLTTLIDALNGTDPSFSAYAAQALSERGTREAMNALSEMLYSSDPSTRLMILQSVAQTEAGLSLLRAALSDPNETVRSAAAVLLQQSEATRNP